MIGAPTRSLFMVLKIVIGLAYILPLIWILLTSLKSGAQVLHDPNAIFFTPTVETYANVIGSGLGAIVTSLQIGVVVTAVVLVVAVPAAFALARRITRFWSIVIAVVLAALLVLQMVPQPMTVIPLYSVLASWGILGTLPGLMLADIALLLPFAIMLLRPFVLAIPPALYEAAEIDGASTFQSFRLITVPMLSNGIFTVMSVVFISAWGEFVYAINFLPEGTVLPVSALLAQQNTTYAANWNNLMALAVLTSLPLLIVFIFTQKRLINGLSLGAVKVTGRVVLAGAFDTKGAEYGFVRDRLAAAGIRSLLLDTGVLGTPSIAADIDRRTVAHTAGEDIDALAAGADRNAAMVAMGRGAARLIGELYDDGAVAGLIVLGGSNAGFVMSQIAPVLPIGCPKILVSTIVSGDTRPYVGTSDLTMIYPVVDIAGLNSISIPVLAGAADACAGMVRGAPLPAPSAARAIACTMFGVTTTCVTAVHDALVADGDEVHIFHATGTGGLALEAMIRSGMFAAVADVTTTELADDLLGGVCTAGPHRLEAAAASGVPQVVSVGALDMVNFGAPETIPERFAGRLFHAHNPAVTLMRTNADECAELGAIMARKLNASTGPVEVVVPARGFSQISVDGAPFYDPEADAALIRSLQENLGDHIPLHIVDAAINDPAFPPQIISALNRVLGTTRSTTEIRDSQGSTE